MGWDTGLDQKLWTPGEALPIHNPGCMVCGPESASSPLVEPFHVLDATQVAARARFDERHQGAPLYAHGGAVAALLDDACGYVAYLVVRMFVTAHLEVDYRKPVVLGREYDVRARCTGVDGRKAHLAAELAEGTTSIAEATGLFVVVDVEHFRV